VTAVPAAAVDLIRIRIHTGVVGMEPPGRATAERKDTPVPKDTYGSAAEVVVPKKQARLAIRISTLEDAAGMGFRAASPARPNIMRAAGVDGSTEAAGMAAMLVCKIRSPTKEAEVAPGRPADLAS